jgi:hypothetical protein
MNQSRRFSQNVNNLSGYHDTKLNNTSQKDEIKKECPPCPPCSPLGWIVAFILLCLFLILLYLYFIKPVSASCATTSCTACPTCNSCPSCNNSTGSVTISKKCPVNYEVDQTALNDPNNNPTVCTSGNCTSTINVNCVPISVSANIYVAYNTLY